MIFTCAECEGSGEVDRSTGWEVHPHVVDCNICNARGKTWLPPLRYWYYRVKQWWILRTDTDQYDDIPF